MQDIIIRKAKQDYICGCCGHKIKRGEEYIDKFDVKSRMNVTHFRYHDVCPAMQRKGLIEILINILQDEPLPVCMNGCKYKIYGVAVITLKHKQLKMVHYTDWEGKNMYCMLFERAVKKFYNEQYCTLESLLQNELDKGIKIGVIS